MGIESWMVSLIIAFIGAVSSFAVIKQKVNEGGSKDREQDDRLKTLEKFMNEKTPFLDHLSKVENAYGKKLDDHSNALVEVKEKITQAPTMTEVRNEFVSKEMFKQMEKHIDEKFDKLENGIEKILTKLEKGS
jgi:phosphopantetheine adenylyltransferase